MIYLDSGTFSTFSIQLSTVFGGTASRMELIAEDSRKIWDFNLLDLSQTSYYSEYNLDCATVSGGHYKAKFYGTQSNLIKTDIAIVSRDLEEKKTFEIQIQEKKTFDPLNGN
jgi:hypothetical protein